MNENDIYQKEANKIWNGAWNSIHRYSLEPRNPTTPWVPLEPDSPVKLSLSRVEVSGSKLVGVLVRYKTENDEAQNLTVIEANGVKDKDGEIVNDLSGLNELIEGQFKHLLRDFVPTSNYLDPSKTNSDLPVKAYTWDELPDSFNMKKKIEKLHSA